MTLTVHSMRTNAMSTVHLTDDEVRRFAKYYAQMSDTFRKKVTTLQDFIAFVMSANI